MSPYEEMTGGIFEIFQNRHIFLKFLFFKNIKKKKSAGGTCEPAQAPMHGPRHQVEAKQADRRSS